MDSEGNTHRMSYPGVAEASTVKDILINAFNPNQKFVLCERYQRSSDKSMIFVFDDAGTLSDMSDDKYRTISLLYDQDNKAIHFNSYCPR